MRAIDTNVLVRLVTADDAAQLEIARAILDEPLLLLPTVVMETIWVLGSVYRLPRSMIAERLRRIFGYDLAHVTNGGEISWALDRFEAGADFADMLHLALAAHAGAKSFATFDRNLDKAAGGQGLVVEILR